MKRRKIQEQAAKYGEITVKAASLQYFLFVGLVSQLCILWLSRQAQLFPGAEVFQQLVSTSAEIVAGLYGITMASYTFFLSRMDSSSATDATLDYVIAHLKNRYKYLAWYITATTAATLGISVIIMYYPAESGTIPQFSYRLICNEYILFLAFTVVMILYYSVTVISPSCIEKEARKLRGKLSRDTSYGSTVEFIALYDQIETACCQLLPCEVVKQLRDNKGNRFELIVDLLSEERPHLRPVIADLLRIHRYYSCTVNCKPMRVSEEMCISARYVLNVLNGTAGDNYKLEVHK